MREMKDSGVPWIGDIPVDWNVSIVLSEFEEVKNINKGMLEKNLLSLSYGNIVRKEINSNNGLLPDSFETYNIIPQNSIVLRLTDLQNDKRSLRSAICNEQGIITSAYTTIQLKSDIENHPRYMNYLFRCYDDCKVFYGLGNGVRQSINYSELKRVAILKPSYNCQMQIAKYLDTKCTQIDTIITKEQSVIEKLQEYKRAIITNAVVKGLDLTVEMVDSGIEWIDSIPNYWKIKRLIFSAYIRARLGWKGLKTDEYTSEGHPFLSAVNIQNDKLVWEDLNFINDNRYDESPEIKLELGDLLLVKDGAGIGKCAVVDQLPYGTATTNSSLGVITPYPELNSMYLYYFFKSAIFQTYISRIKNGMGVPHLTQGNLKNIMVVIPPYCEQEAIVAYLDKKCSNLDSIILKKQALIDKLAEYKKSLIYEVVTGKKEVPHV